jgi:hypothetical protein
MTVPGHTETELSRQMCKIRNDGERKNRQNESKDQKKK